MKKLDRVSAAFWLIFSGLVAIESHRLGVGSFRSPGPGFLPFFSSVFLGLLALALLIDSARATGVAAMPEEGTPSGSWKSPARALAALSVYVVLLETLGFLLCTLGLIAFLLRVVERKSWPVAISTAVLAALGSVVVFQFWLKIQLPPGIVPIYF